MRGIHYQLQLEMPYHDLSEHCIDFQISMVKRLDVNKNWDKMNEATRKAVKKRAKTLGPFGNRKMSGPNSMAA